MTASYVLVVPKGFFISFFFIAMFGCDSRTVSPEQNEIRDEIENIITGLELYLIDNGHYPGQSDWISALQTLNGSEGNPYIQDYQLFLDPWGREYLYEYDENNNEYKVYSLGADGLKGGSELNQDIVENNTKGISD